MCGNHALPHRQAHGRAVMRPFQGAGRVEAASMFWAWGATICL